MHVMLANRTRACSLVGVALCAVALFALMFALTGCPDSGGNRVNPVPVITLTGDEVIVVIIGDTTTDTNPGATVIDGDDPAYSELVAATIRDSAGTIVTEIDTAAAGAYTITYTAPIDADGNTPVAVTRTVRVEADTTSPVIALTGANPLLLEFGDTFEDPGAIATDNDPIYGSVMATPTIRDGAGAIVTEISTAAVGEYIITYIASDDAAENTPAPITRTVRVQDPAPVITLMGSAVIVVAIGDTTTDTNPGATVMDNDLSYMEMVVATIRDSDGTIVDAVDTTAAGEYTITYTAPVDAAGRAPIPVIRTVRIASNSLDSDADNLIEINFLEELDAVRHNLAGTSYRATAGGGAMQCGTAGTTRCVGYELMRDLDFADSTSYADGTVNNAWRPTAGSTVIVAPDSATNDGWNPIGSCESENTGNNADVCVRPGDTPLATRFEGNGFTITNLYARGGRQMGLFGASTGTIEHIGVVDVSIYGGGSSDRVGGLVGVNTGIITESHATGSVNGGAGRDFVGGLVGVHGGQNNRNRIITNSYAMVSVSGGTNVLGNTVGGLIGNNRRRDGALGILTTVIGSYATGDVTGGVGGSQNVGGLIGNSGLFIAVIDSYATGDVTGGVQEAAGLTDNVGGLIGFNAGRVTASYATGDVDGGGVSPDRVGGLVGFTSREITASYATGSVIGSAGDNHIGGLVGFSIGTITASYATGDVDGGGGDDTVGGLVGLNGSTLAGSVTASYATGMADGGEGAGDTVGELVGANSAAAGVTSTITASYGFGMATGELEGITRSEDASPLGTVANACTLTRANSSTMTGPLPDTPDTRWDETQWDFGTRAQGPAVRRENDELVPGQTDRACRN